MFEKMGPNYILRCLILSIFVLSYAQEAVKPDFKAKIEYQSGIRVISNQENPIFGERRFNFIGKRVIDKKFNYVYLDLDTNQNLFILDILEKKIFKFTKEGVYQLTIESNRMIEPDGLFIDDTNKVYVKDRRSIHVFSNKGTYCHSLEFPFFIGDFAVTSKQKIIAATSYHESDKMRWAVELFDLEGNHLKTLFEHSESDPNLRFAKFSSRFHPKLILRHNKKFGVFAFSSDYKIYLINEEGEISLMIKRQERPQPLSKKEIDEINSVDKSAWIPQYKPFFYDLFLDDEGNIFVEKWKNGNPSFDYFNSDGYLLYKIESPVKPIYKVMSQQIYCGEFVENSRYVKIAELRFKLK